MRWMDPGPPGHSQRGYNQTVWFVTSLTMSWWMEENYKWFNLDVMFNDKKGVLNDLLHVFTIIEIVFSKIEARGQEVRRSGHCSEGIPVRDFSEGSQERLESREQHSTADHRDG